MWCNVRDFGYDRLPKNATPVGVPELPPDLVIEVRSPSDSWRSMTRKALEYYDAEVKVVFLVDTEDQTAMNFRADGKTQTVAAD